MNKNCPFCSKSIGDDWNRCAHCGNFLVGSNLRPENLPKPSKPQITSIIAKPSNASKICPSCGTKNNQNFSGCWKCGTSLKDASLEGSTTYAIERAKKVVNEKNNLRVAPNVLPEASSTNPQASDNLKQSKTTASEMWLVFLGCVGGAWFFGWYAFSLNTSGLRFLIYILVSFVLALFALLSSLVMFRWVRWAVCIGLGLWGVTSLFQGLAALSTTQFLLLLIFIAIASKR